MKKLNLQMFAEVTNFDGEKYCDFSASATAGLGGKDILLCIFNAAGDKLLAIAGQRGLTLNRTKESIEITSKDSEGGWKSRVTGMKEWSIENDGVYITSDETHGLLSKAFEEDTFVCLKIINNKTKTAMFGGLATITEYPIEAPYDDALTYSLTLEGTGPLVDLSKEVEPGTLPE